MTPELETRIKDVLARLALLSEAPAGMAPQLAPPKRGEQGYGRLKPTDQMSQRRVKPARHSESAPPRGSRLDLSRDRPPPMERSLHDWFAWQFADVLREPAGEGRTELLENLCWLAEEKYRERRFHSPKRNDVRSGALTENNVRDGGAAERAAAERVVEWYEGVPAAQVAYRERCTETWVRKARRMYDRQPHDGTPRPEFLGWDEDQRQREVARMAESMGAKVIADKLRVSKRTVQRYMPGPQAAAA